MQEYIFIVGKADPLDASLQAIRHAGYKAGLFQDSTVAVRDPSKFDKVVPLDFTQLETIDYSVVGGIRVAGLLTSYENYIPAKALIGSKLGLPVPSQTSAARCTDKLLMREAFAAHDPSLSPAFREISSIDDAVAFSREFGYPVIIKPTNLVKSLLVTRCNNEDELARTVGNALADIVGLYKKYKIYGREPKLIIEQFMEGDLYSVAAFAGNNKDIFLCPGITALTSAQQAGFDDNFLYKRQLPAVIDPALQARLFATAREGITALGLQSSAAHVELMHTRTDEIKLIEIGARIGGYRPRMYHLSYGTDLHDVEIAIATDNEVRPLPQQANAYTAVYELFPHGSGKFDCLIPEPQVEALKDSAFSLNIKVPHGGLCGPAQEGYKAVAVIIVSSSDEQEFTEQCAAVEKLEVRLV